MHDFPPRISTVGEWSYEQPDWSALERFASDELCGWFMWMGSVSLADGGTIHAYKHRATRRYSHLTDDGRGFIYLGFLEEHLPSGFHETTLATALMASLGEWECLMPWPDDMPAIRRDVGVALRMALHLDLVAQAG